MADRSAKVTAWLQEIASGTLDLNVDIRGLAAAALGSLRQPKLPPGNLTRHFTLEEFIYSDTAQAEGIDNTPDDAVSVELQELARTMEGVRALCGSQPVFITSGYRCPDLNAAVGGAANSAHLYGAACDFTIPDCGSPNDICHLLEQHLEALGIDQLIDETGGGARWVHLGRAIPPNTVPRCECLTVNAYGTAVGFA